MARDDVSCWGWDHIGAAYEYARRTCTYARHMHMCYAHATPSQDICRIVATYKAIGYAH